MYFFYAHLSSICVSKGDLVNAGQLLGYTGDTGNAAQYGTKISTGAHLHFEVREFDYEDRSKNKGLNGRADPL